ncbi:MAG: PaaI family thioesterase [Acidimicrobiales bacterium]
MPFAQTLGVEVLAADPDEVRARLSWHELLCTAGGVLHGGVLMALADSTGALCAYLNLPDGASTTTIESKTNFLRAVADGHVDAVSRPLQRGRRIIVVETDLMDDHARLVARITQSQLVLSPPP